MPGGCWVTNSTGKQLCLVIYSLTDSHFWGIHCQIHSFLPGERKYVACVLWDVHGLWVTVVLSVDQTDRVAIQYWHVYNGEDVAIEVSMDGRYIMPTVQHRKSWYAYRGNGRTSEIRNFRRSFLTMMRQVVNATESYSGQPSPFWDASRESLHKKKLKEAPSPPSVPKPVPAPLQGPTPVPALLDPELAIPPPAQDPPQEPAPPAAARGFHPAIECSPFSLFSNWTTYFKNKSGRDIVVFIIQGHKGQDLEELTVNAAAGGFQLSCQVKLSGRVVTEDQIPLRHNEKRPIKYPAVVVIKVPGDAARIASKETLHGPGKYFLINTAP